jgi:hypothetical protein
MKYLITLLLCLGLCGCGEDAPDTLGQQRLGDMVIVVQCRPMPVTVGMNEFLVLATDVHGAPIHDLLVDLRMRDGDPWRQAIQDGFSGVYRKALGVGSLTEQLQVRLKQGKKITELRFPLVKSG